MFCISYFKNFWSITLSGSITSDNLSLLRSFDNITQLYIPRYDSRATIAGFVYDVLAHWHGYIIIYISYSYYSCFLFINLFVLLLSMFLFFPRIICAQCVRTYFAIEHCVTFIPHFELWNLSLKPFKTV